MYITPALSGVGCRLPKRQPLLFLRDTILSGKPQQPKKPKRVIIYIDGFNFYYGCLKGTNLKWVNPQKLVENMLTDIQVVGVKYFSARVEDRPNDPQATRQDVYYRAIQTLPNSSVVLGHYLTHRVWMRLVRPADCHNKKSVNVLKTEEKGSDVNLATHLLMDGFENNFDAAVVISNDSDLTLPVRMTKQKLKKLVFILNPHPQDSIQLKRFATVHKKIAAADLQAAQFPNSIMDAQGNTITKPATW